MYLSTFPFLTAVSGKYACIGCSFRRLIYSIAKYSKYDKDRLPEFSPYTLRTTCYALLRTVNDRVIVSSHKKSILNFSHGVQKHTCISLMYKMHGYAYLDLRLDTSSCTSYPALR
jgi:hypothetical protein